MIIFSDLHLCEKTSDTVFNEVFPGLRKAVLEEEDNTLVCLGDFYHIRYKVDVSLQNRVFDYFEKMTDDGVTIILLPGNHDQVDDSGENALQPFSKLSRVIVHSDFASTDLGIFIPYRRDKAKIVEYLSSGASFGNSTIFIHHGIRGFSLNNTMVDKDGIEPSIFKNRLVLSGHYHKRQQIGNICYIGSPYQIDSGEAGQGKGYCTFDGKNLNYVTTDWGPKYHNISSVEDCNKYLRNGEVLVGEKGDVVRLKAPQGVDLEKFRKSLVLREGVSCIVEPAIEESEARLGTGLNTVQEYAEAYVDEFRGTLDKGILLDTLKQLGI